VALSSNVVAEIPAPEAGPEASTPTPRRAAVPSGLASTAVLSLAVAVLVALAVHLFLPNGQRPSVSWVNALPPWLHPYPAALEGLLAAAALLAAAQWAWRPLRAWTLHNAPLAAGAVVLFCVWELFTLKLNWMTLPYFPGPDAVLAALVKDRNILLESTWDSLLLLLTGYAAGVCAGLVTGVSIGWFPRVRYWGMTILKVVGPLPVTALVPLVMTASSQSFVSAAELVAFAVWFPVTMLTASGISNVRLSYLDVARTLGAGRLYLIFCVAIPAALPNIFLGLFMGLGASFLTLIVAETVGRPAGLGWYLTWQQGFVEYANVYASILIMMVFFSTLMTVLFKVRDRVLKWQKGVIKW
jgi:NitT/TauT family transport system permease protein